MNNQIHELERQLNQALARKKRLDIEKQKTQEKLSLSQGNLESAVFQREEEYQKLIAFKKECDELLGLQEKSIREKDGLAARINSLENEKNVLNSQKEFLSNLKLQYENITESSNAYILLDNLTNEKISGIIIKVADIQSAAYNDTEIFNQARFRVKGLAKPISLDPQEIIDKIELLEREIAQTGNQLSQKAELCLELLSKLSSAQGSLRKTELDYNKYGNQKDNAQEQYDKLREELELVGLELRETTDELDKLNTQEKQLKEQLNKLKIDVHANQEAMDIGLEQITAQNSQREKALLVITQVRLEIRGCEEKTLGLQQTYTVLEEACSKDKNNIISLADEERNLEERMHGSEESLKSLAAEIDTAFKQKEHLEEEAALILDGLAQLKNKLKDLQDAIAQRKARIDGIKVKIHEFQMQQQELTFEQNGIYERMQQVYKVDADTLRGYFSPDSNSDEAGQEIELLKQKLESYGQVNLVAIDEFEELKQRFDFLSSQQADLLKAKESLHEAILKINRTTKKMFLETFEKLAVEFKNYFRLLFGGGDAQLFLIDEQDVLESGIEIVCRPPGKKLQNVLLLSGGEKSMAAIALLFAIFKVKPSPFCVLDEIDAALDESNVDRFSRMLVDFTSQSQFIVITHNKKTIANANIMYGITMEKAGISKIVSVKLAENKHKQSADNSLNPSQEQGVLEPA